MLKFKSIKINVLNTCKIIFLYRMNTESPLFCEVFDVYKRYVHF